MVIWEPSVSERYTPPPCAKHPYRTKGAALGARRGLLKSGKARRHQGRLIVYFCPECRVFHVGHRES